MKNKIIIGICLGFLILCCSIQAVSYRGIRTVEEIIIDIASHVDPNSVLLDVGSDDGDVMIWFSEQGIKEVKGMEMNSFMAETSRGRKDANGDFLNVTTGDAVRITWPEADVYYIWITLNVTSQIIEKIETEDIKGTFILGHQPSYIFKEFCKARGMTFHVTPSWFGDFEWWEWVR